MHSFVVENMFFYRFNLIIKHYFELLKKKIRAQNFKIYNSLLFNLFILIYLLKLKCKN